MSGELGEGVLVCSGGLHKTGEGEEGEGRWVDGFWERGVCGVCVHLT